ncbi:MAG: MmcQ/YjbR family DNA-binding protein [Bacteroidales bacterium]
MNIEQLREYCLSLPEAEEGMPFDDSILVFKVCGKLFVLTSLFETPLFVNLKCDQERAIELREQFECVEAGYHMNKKMWNTITMTDEMSDAEVKKWIRHSYEEVIKKLPKKDRTRFIISPDPCDL